ncbi:MAG: enoyl-CoA hydratase/isomerase family protein [Crocinitomicaceae bacterium]|jgi:methylglutaconyl-CoA hydratase|nr:enoyl-CoA hydratase/isomerase family protein [Crocinitomicaceae bacterium]
MTNSGKVVFETSNGVGTIAFEHPASNSLPGELLSEIAECIDRAASDDQCSVVVLKSGGNRAFCAGASFDELVAIENKAKGLIFFSGFSKVILAIRRCPKFVICRVQGKAVGGGVGIAAAADYTLATIHASVKLSELAIGIGPFVVGPAVERKVGLSAFQSLAIDATKWFSAEWAMNNGLYACLHSTVEELDADVLRIATQLAKSSPEAMAQLKRAAWHGTDHWETLLPERAAISGELVLSEFTKEAIQAFKSKTS